MNQEFNNDPSKITQENIDNSIGTTPSNVTGVENNPTNVVQTNIDSSIGTNPSNIAGGFDNGPVMEEKRSKTPLLIGLGVIIVFLIGIGVFFYFNGHKTQNIYYKTIDEFADALKENVGTVNKEVKDVLGSEMELSLNLKTNDSDMKALANILNKLKLTVNAEASAKDKKIYASVGAKYNNGNLINGELLVNNNSIYGNVKDLYNRPIKLYEDDSLSEIWNVTDTTDYETIITEMAKIIKSSLKEEYFTKTEEKITVLGSEVAVYNHTLKLNGDQIYEIENALMDGMLNDEALLKALANVAEIEMSELKTNLTDAKSSIEKDDRTLESNIYVNKKNDKLEMANVKISGAGVDETLALNKSAEDTFDILVSNTKVGTFTNTENNMELKINYEDTTLNFQITKQGNSTDITISAEAEGITMELILSDNDGAGTLKLRINVPEADVDLTLNATYKEKDINKVTEFSTSNYIKLEDMTENDYNSMMEKLQNNQNLLNLIQDIMSIEQSLPGSLGM